MTEVAMTRYAVLLRGINVGRAKQVGMPELRRLLTERGYQSVATLLRSGNVVLSTQAPADAVARSVRQVVADGFGFPADAVIRTREEFLAVLARDPFPEMATDGSKYLVVFLTEPPAPAVVTALRAIEAGDDRLAIDGRELYVWCPNGLTGSPVMDALGRLKGGPVATVRNWNTVRKLAAMLD